MQNYIGIGKVYMRNSTLGTYYTYIIIHCSHYIHYKLGIAILIWFATGTQHKVYT